MLFCLILMVVLQHCYVILKCGGYSLSDVLYQYLAYYLSNAQTSLGDCLPNLPDMAIQQGWS